jgi:hypothetical protein
MVHEKYVVVAPIESGCPLKKNVRVIPIGELDAFGF